MSIIKHQPTYFFPFDYHPEYRYPTIVVTEDFFCDTSTFCTFFTNKGFIVAVTKDIHSVSFDHFVDPSNLFVCMVTWTELPFSYKGFAYRQTRTPLSDTTASYLYPKEDSLVEENFYALYTWFIQKI